MSEKDNNSSGQKDQENNTKYIDADGDMKVQMWFMKEKLIFSAKCAPRNLADVHIYVDIYEQSIEK